MKPLLKPLFQTLLAGATCPRPVTSSSEEESSDSEPEVVYLCGLPYVHAKKKKKVPARRQTKDVYVTVTDSSDEEDILDVSRPSSCR